MWCLHNSCRHKVVRRHRSRRRRSATTRTATSPTTDRARCSPSQAESQVDSSPLDIPTYADVARAAERLSGVAHRTPVLTSQTLDTVTGAAVFFKCENLQRAGAFKFRGAYNAVSALSDAERKRGVITFSSGNHAQAL